MAKVVSAEKIEGADKLYQLMVDMGGETRQIVSGLAKHYKADELVGKNVIVIANLKPVKAARRGLVRDDSGRLRGRYAQNLHH